jgi:hypothetical protein
MADVFLSYARDDAARAKRVADALQSAGWNVWWDRHIVPGSNFEDVLEQELESARCVVVLWSASSVASPWVRAEADAGSRRAVLVQAFLDDVQPPFGFRRIQGANLTSWAGDVHAEEFTKLAATLARIIDRDRRSSRSVPSAPLRSVRSVSLDSFYGGLVASVFAVLAILAATMLIVYQFRGSTVASAFSSAPDTIWRPLIGVGALVCSAALVVSAVRHSIELVAAIRLVARLRRE